MKAQAAGKNGIVRVRRDAPEDPSGPARANPLSHHRVNVRDVARNRLRIGPIEAVDGTLVVDMKAVLCEAQET
ncbi:MAG TPA: hypothetical protein VN833_29370 [Candidatus Acidoferrales bacterium]|nr:hypothetical protein [Candidatus Acidoferrales bacterium]